MNYSERIQLQNFIKTQIQLLSEMSASHVRAFRHTGTFCAMKLMSALVGVALSVNKEIEVIKFYLKNCKKN